MAGRGCWSCWKTASWCRIWRIRRGAKAIASARLKDDRVDARTLAQLLRADLLPEAWIAPAAVRELRVLLRHRVVLVRLRTSAKNRIHLALIDSLAGPIAAAEAQITARATPGPRVKVLTALPWVGRLTAMTLLAEIGDITRFGSARKLWRTEQARADLGHEQCRAESPA